MSNEMMIVVGVREIIRYAARAIARGSARDRPLTGRWTGNCTQFALLTEDWLLARRLRPAFFIDVEIKQRGTSVSGASSTFIPDPISGHVPPVREQLRFGRLLSGRLLVGALTNADGDPDSWALVAMAVRRNGVMFGPSIGNDPSDSSMMIMWTELRLTSVAT